MRFLVMSDLHIEHGAYPYQLPFVGDYDAVILAGDIAPGRKSLNWAKDTFKNKDVFLVNGNHSFYGGDIDRIREKQQNILKEKEYSNIKLLDPGAIVAFDIAGDVLIVGATLWTDFALDPAVSQKEAMAKVGQALNDFYLIKKNGERFTPEDSYNEHQRDLNFIDSIINSTSFEFSKLVIITHHAPSPMSIHDDYKHSSINAGFVSNLEDKISEWCPDLWVHGHVHNSFDYKIDQTRVVCNPKGYPIGIQRDENRMFNPNFIVEI